MVQFITIFTISLLFYKNIIYFFNFITFFFQKLIIYSKFYLGKPYYGKIFIITNHNDF